MLLDLFKYGYNIHLLKIANGGNYNMLLGKTTSIYQVSKC